MLNQPLYNALHRICGEVDVVHEDEPGSPLYRAHRGNIYLDFEKDEITQEFKVDCPICGDTRKRLYINYAILQDIKKGGVPVKTYHLMCCHNERCNLGPFYKELKEAIKNPEIFKIQPKPNDGKRRCNVRTDLPGVCHPINSDNAHIACKVYMQERGFDLNELYKQFHVMSCDRMDGMEYFGPVIIFPYYEGNSLVFWQARLPYNPTDKKTPKYIFGKGTKKSTIVYNKASALKEPVIIITEGVLDAIRVGPAGIALFGKYPSEMQTRIMSRVFALKKVVLMLDSDASKESVLWYEKYKNKGLFEKGLYLCKLDQGDPADMTREAIWQKVEEVINAEG
jgi:hypothetical protein